MGPPSMGLFEDSLSLGLLTYPRRIALASPTAKRTVAGFVLQAAAPESGASRTPISRTLGLDKLSQPHD